MYHAIGVLIVVARVAYMVSQRTGPKAASQSVDLRRTLTVTLVTVWVLFGIPLMLLLWGFSLSQGSAAGILFAVAVTAAYLGVWAPALAGWHVLRALARRGRPRLVYALARLSLTFGRTGQTRSAATLLAALAMAHRGRATREEREWLKSTLVRETRFLGTYATAWAFVLALDARAARDEGRRAEAADLEESARVLLGTVTYLSKAAVPAGVRGLAFEYLALASARAAEWGGVDVPPGLRPTRVHALLNEWFSVFMRGTPPTAHRPSARECARSPLYETLAKRPCTLPPVGTKEESQARMTRCMVALSSGEPLAPREMLNTLLTLDALTHPRLPDSPVPPEIRDDEESLARLHDEIASTVADTLRGRFVPIHAMPQYGPISARVHHKLESALMQEWATQKARIDERRQSYERRPAYQEWMEISRVRSLYRRVDYCLGESAAMRMWPEFAQAYGFLGVRLSETLPRMRPLAHTVFAVMAKEAERFGDRDNIALQATNMKVTAGV